MNKWDKVKTIASSIAVSIISAYGIVQLLEDFKIVSLTSYGGKGLLLLVLAVVLFFLIRQFIYWILSKKPASEDLNQVQCMINERLGTLKSGEKPSENVVDKIHKYSAIERTDILDYDQDHYLSYRVLEGMNISKNASSYITYSEGTDSKTSFEQLKIFAFDLIEQRELKVEPINAGEKTYNHKFKIHFSKPVAPKGKFKILYFIYIPEELSQLSNNRELMSISLNRYYYGVDNLKFNVLLNFTPLSAKTFLLKDGKTVSHSECEIDVSAEKFESLDRRIKSYIEKCIPEGINIESKLSIIVPKPQQITYIIYYEK